MRAQEVKRPRSQLPTLQVLRPPLQQLLAPVPTLETSSLFPSLNSRVFSRLSGVGPPRQSFMNAKRSALITSACVVIKPCGAPG